LFDVANPLEPEEVGSYDPEEDYVAVRIQGERVLVFTVAGAVHTVDVANPGVPVLVGVAALSYPIEDADIAGDMVYSVEREAGLRYYRLESPDLVVPLGVCDVPKMPTKVSVAGGLVFVEDHPGIDGYGEHLVVLEELHPR
jgi:hypothetical protein